MQASVSYRNYCRCCQSTNLERILSLPEMPLHDQFITDKLIEQEFKANLDIYVCLNCYTVQTQHDVDLSAYYEDYQYSVGHSKTATTFMEALADALLNKYFPNTNNLRVLEVGSGDGSQLLPFKQMGCEVLGYEPSAPVAKIAQERGITTIQGLFDKNSLDKLPENFKNKSVDIVITSYTFDHLPDPVEFLQAVKLILNPDRGLLVVEVHDIEKLLSRREFCLFQHEHSIYLSERAAQTMLERQEYAIIDFDIVPESVRRANSLIFVATPDRSSFTSKKISPVDKPNLRRLTFYQSQAAQIQEGIQNLERLVDKLTQAGRKVAGYGAGGRGILTLAAMSNGNKLEYLVDKKPKGVGIYTSKSHVPVFGLEKLKESPVDDILVFSFGYMKEIQEDLQPFGYKADQFYSMIDVTEGKVS